MHAVVPKRNDVVKSVAVVLVFTPLFAIDAQLPPPVVLPKLNPTSAALGSLVVMRCPVTLPTATSLLENVNFWTGRYDLIGLTSTVACLLLIAVVSAPDSTFAILG